MRVLWWTKRADVQLVFIAQYGEHLIQRSAAVQDVNDIILVDIREAISGELAAKNLAGIIARVLEDVGPARYILNVEVPPEFGGFAGLYFVDALRDAALLKSIVEPGEFEHRALHEDVTILPYCHKHTDGVFLKVLADQEGFLHGPKVGR